MEQQKFIKILRKVIKEEVESVIKQELTSILKEGLQSTVNSLQESKKNKKPVTKSVKKKTHFKDNKFSDILNDTEYLSEHRSVSDYADLMKEDIVMSSKDAMGFGVQRTQSTIMTDPESGKSMKVAPSVQKAMNRDYSGLMKAIDKKRGN